MSRASSFFGNRKDRAETVIDVGADLFKCCLIRAVVGTQGLAAPAAPADLFLPASGPFLRFSFRSCQHLHFSAADKVAMVRRPVFAAEHRIRADGNMKCPRHFLVQQRVSAQVGHIRVHAEAQLADDAVFRGRPAKCAATASQLLPVISPFVTCRVTSVYASPSR